MICIDSDDRVCAHLMGGRLHRPEVRKCAVELEHDRRGLERSVITFLPKPRTNTKLSLPRRSCRTRRHICELPGGAGGHPSDGRRHGHHCRCRSFNNLARRSGKQSARIRLHSGLTAGLRRSRCRPRQVRPGISSRGADVFRIAIRLSPRRAVIGRLKQFNSQVLQN